MAINVTLANSQADQLYSYIAQLRQAKSQLATYKNIIISNWQGTEVKYIQTGIEQTSSQIDNAIRQLESLCNEIRGVAAQIKREDDAAAAAARAAALKQQRIQAAQNAYNASCSELDVINNERENILKKIKSASGSKLKKLKEELQKIEEKLANAQKKRNDCLNALNNARRS